MSQVEKKALEARDKPAKYGTDLDLGEYTSEAPAYEKRNLLSEIDIVDEERLLDSGVDVSEKERSGSFIQVDGSVIHAKPTQEGIEIMSTRDALDKYDWVEDYAWKLIDPGTDKYTARAALDFHDGYFVRAMPGQKTIFPVQACLYLKSEDVSQNVHNIVVAEEGSELHIITGCATDSPHNRGLHVGISEFYIKKNAKITFTMIHNWSEKVVVRPRSAVRIEEGGVYINNYISMHPVSSLQLNPTSYLVGRGATARFNSVLLCPPGSEMDVGSVAILSAPEARCEMISRALSTGGRIVARGKLVGEVEGVKGHLECQGMILKGDGEIHAIPELDGKVAGVEMSHEAAVGKIANEEVEYLMARGLTESEAISTIVRGFMNVDIEGLPELLKEQIDKAIEISEQYLI